MVPFNIDSKKLFSQPNIIRLVAIGLIFISQVGLKKFNNDKDYFIFSTWNLYNKGPRKKVDDVTWDNGESYLFRDNLAEAIRLKINVHSFHYLLRGKKYDKIELLYCTKIRKLAGQKDIYIYTVKSSLADQIILKKTSPVLNSVRICDDQ